MRPAGAPPGQIRGAVRALDAPERRAGGSASWDLAAPADARGGSWVDGPASSPSPRGLSLAYRYRALPPGSESRFEWIVQVRGDAALLAGVETVTWRMEPPPRHGGDLVSRDRAADGFPLFGDGPGGWFGVSATVRFKDGGAETLGRRVELPEPP